MIRGMKTTICIVFTRHLLNEEDSKQASKKKKKTPQLHDCLNRLVLPRRSLSIVTAMSSRNVIRHYMRSDTGGLLVWHIRDMLRINMQWCQLKAWNALRGKLECFPCAPNSLRQNEWGGMMGCAEVTISTTRKFLVGDYRAGRRCAILCDLL